MTSFSAKEVNDLTLKDLKFIVGVALEGLKTTQNALSFIKDDQLDLPLSEWVKLPPIDSKDKKVENKVREKRAV